MLLLLLLLLLLQHLLQVFHLLYNHHGQSDQNRLANRFTRTHNVDALSPLQTSTRLCRLHAR